MFGNLISFRGSDKKPQEQLHPQGNGFKYLIDMLAPQGTPTGANAHTYNTVYAPVNVLSDDIAKLPVKVYRKVKDSIERAQEHPVNYLLSVRPNEYMTPFVFKKYMITSLCFYGNFYALIKYDSKGDITGLYPLDPSATTVVQGNKLGAHGFQTVIGGKTRTLKPYDVFHVMGLSADGYSGVSPIRAIANQIKGSRQAEHLNERLLESGGTPQGILKVATSLNAESKAQIREAWKRANSSEAIAIIDSGLEYQQIGVSQADMQFVEMMKFNQQQIAAIYKVPLHKLNQLDRATFSNIENQSLDYIKNTLQPLVVQIEDEARYKLFTRSEVEQGYYIKFNLDSELRGDAEARAKVEKIHIESGVRTVNEIRINNDWSPYDGDYGDKPLMTLNNTFLENLSQYQLSRVGAGDTKIEQLKGGEGDGKDETVSSA